MFQNKFLLHEFSCLFVDLPNSRSFVDTSREVELEVLSWFRSWSSIVRSKLIEFKVEISSRSGWVSPNLYLPCEIETEVLSWVWRWLNSRYKFHRESPTAKSRLKSHRKIELEVLSWDRGWSSVVRSRLSAFEVEIPSRSRGWVFLARLRESGSKCTPMYDLRLRSWSSLTKSRLTEAGSKCTPMCDLRLTHFRNEFLQYLGRIV